MNLIIPARTLEKEALEQYLDGGFNEAAVRKQVANGKNAMPAFGGRLSDEDIANVAAYVISSSTDGWTRDGPGRGVIFSSAVLGSREASDAAETSSFASGAERAFNVADVNHDGKLTPEEFEPLYRKLKNLNVADGTR